VGGVAGVAHDALTEKERIRYQAVIDVFAATIVIAVICGAAVSCYTLCDLVWRYI
jgi:hypothetical protein